MDTPLGDPKDRYDRYRAPALEKGLDILELLADQGGGLTQREICAHLGRSINELFRMLICLERRGYIGLAEPGDRYVLTLKLFELSNRHPPVKRLISEALPLMNELAHQVGQSCHLVVQNSGTGLVVAQVDSPTAIGFAVRMGAQLDLCLTASGHVLLAFQDAETRAGMLDARGRTAAPAPPPDLGPHLDRIRTRGFEEMDSLQTRGVRDVSFPVRDFRGHAEAALTIPFLERIDGQNPAGLDQARELLRQAAGRLSAALGGPSDG